MHQEKKVVKTVRNTIQYKVHFVISGKTPEEIIRTLIPIHMITKPLL